MIRRWLLTVMIAGCFAWELGGMTASASGVVTGGDEEQVTMPVIAGAIEHEEKKPGTGSSAGGGSTSDKGATKPEPEVIVIYLPSPDTGSSKEGGKDASKGRSEKTGTAPGVGKTGTVGATGKTAATASTGKSSAGTGSSSAKTVSSAVGRTGEAGAGSGASKGSEETKEAPQKTPEAQEIRTGTGAEEGTGGIRLPGFLLWLIPLLMLLGLAAYLALTGRLTGLWMALYAFVFRKRAFIWHGRLPVSAAGFVKVRKAEKADTTPLQEIIDRTADTEELYEAAVQTGYETILPCNTRLILAYSGEDGNRQVLRMKAEEQNLYDFLTEQPLTGTMKATIYNDAADFECALIFRPWETGVTEVPQEEGNGYDRTMTQIRRQQEEHEEAEEASLRREVEAREREEELQEETPFAESEDEETTAESDLPPDLKKARLRALKEKEREEKRVDRMIATEQEETDEPDGTGGASPDGRGEC